MEVQELVLAERLQALILSDPNRRALLETAERLQREFQLPDALLAAGFVRNCCWDHLHRFDVTPFNDVDLIYFDATELCADRDLLYSRRLSEWMPGIEWEVKNQSRMGLQHGDPSYDSTLDAMRYWPERETAVAIRLDGSRQVVSAYGLKSLFDGVITPGPYRDRALCLRRVQQKQWLRLWPKLRLL